ncbi:hypothetical protein ASPCAL14459 [Aspergillus calidoustus]|uniref:Glycosyl hydrolase family 43 protein n=1 Tax=Aspergillus calidoustus TaxID=454130 RepID=A0A0U5CJU8_ASPCI|nr:hypothetical protein ASPCAL14459 [Aspergillus calidoustus]
MLIILTLVMCATLAAAGGSLAPAVQINPGLSWPVRNGRVQHLQAHGAGFFYEDGTYYMIGENKTTGPIFQSVSCYRSKDLLHWDWVNDLLTADATIPDLGPDRVIERPKVIYNKATGKYVLWMHVESSNYSYARAGVAWSDSVCGTYTYVGSYRPLGKYISRDMTAWVDDDETGYLLGEDRPTGLVVYKLSDDYLSIDSLVYNTMEHIESPAIFKADGVYYLLGSQLTGWAPNDNYYTTAESLEGPWSELQLFVPSGSKTYSSQTTFVLKVGDTYIYCGDRWDPENLGGLQASTYVWLPLELDTAARMVNVSWYDSWTLNSISGAWAANLAPPSVYEANSPSNTLSNGAFLTEDDYFRAFDGPGVMNIGGPDGGSLTFHDITITGDFPQMLKIRYQNLEKYVQYASVSLRRKRGSDHSRQDAYAAFLPTLSTRGRTVHTVASVPGLRLTPGVFDLTIKGLPGYTHNTTAAIHSIQFD